MRKTLIALISALVLIGTAMFGGSAAIAATNLSVKPTFMKSIPVPSGSQDFHFFNQPQGGQYVQWIVKTKNDSNIDIWQIWYAGFEPMTGTITNQTKVYELPAGTSFLAKPVLSHFPNSVGVVYSTYWQTNAGIYSEVEAITLGVNGLSEHQVVSKFPRIEIAANSNAYQDCLGFWTNCGYLKVAVGGDSSSQTTIAALDYEGDETQVKIGLISSAYFRQPYWTDPTWIPSNLQYNFDSESAFSWGTSGGVFFVYVHRDTSNTIEIRKVTFNNDSTQTVSDPRTLSRIPGGTEPKLTFISGTKSVVTWLNTDYGALEVWASNVDSQNDQYQNDAVIWNATGKSLSANYEVKKVSTDTYQVLIPLNDSEVYDQRIVSTMTVSLSDGSATPAWILPGNNFELAAVLGDSYTSPDGTFGFSVKFHKSIADYGSIAIYSPDFGVIPVPIKSKKSAIVDSTVFGSFFDASFISVANLKLGNQQFLEISKIVSKLPAVSTLNFTTWGGRSIGQGLSVTGPGWSSFSYLGTTSHQWLRCTKILPTKVVGIPKFCKPISGATQSTYTLTTADRGKYVTVELSAQNRNGKSSVVAASTKQVQ